MSNELRLGAQPAGNTLYLTPAGFALGSIVDQDAVFGIPSTFGAVFEFDIVSGIGLRSVTAIGAVEDVDVLFGIGRSNIGYGAIVDQDVTENNNTLAVGRVLDEDGISGVGEWTFWFAPTKIWPGFTSDGTSVSIPIAELGGQLTAAEADTATGDWREVLMALLLSVNAYHKAMPVKNRPRTFQSNELVDWNYQHRQLGRVIRREIWERINIEFSTRKVADEV